MNKLQPIKNPKNFFEFVFWIINVSIVHFWKIVIAVTITSTIAIVGVLTADEKFKSEAIVYIPSSESGGLKSALAKMANLGVGSLKLPGSSTDMDLVLTILNTRDLLDGVIHKFNLIEANQIDTTQSTWYTSTMKYLKKNIITEITDEDAIVIGFKDTSYVRAYEITEYLVFALDSMYSDVNQVRNKKNMEFYQSRLDRSKQSLRVISDSLIAFSQGKNIIDIDIQLEESIKQIAELEGKARWLTIEINSLNKTANVSKTMVAAKKNQLSQIKRELRKIKTSNSGSVLLSSKNLNRDMNSYYELYREYEIRESLYQFLRQSLEEKLLNEGKTSGNIVVIQKPWINKKRIAPPRSAIVISVFMLTLLFGIIYAVAKENYRLNRDGNVAVLIREALANFRRHILLKTTK